MLLLLAGAFDTDLMFLRSPIVRERAGKATDREIGWCAAVNDGFDDARRHEGERGKVSDVALDLVLASGDFFAGLGAQSLSHIFQCPEGVSPIRT